MRARRALVVGLGGASAAYLNAIAAKFHTENQADAVRCVLLRPPDENIQSHAAVHKYNMNLSTEQLNTLYYKDAHVRTWSSANWWGWKDELFPHTRLGGKLAIYAHHMPLEEWLTNQINLLYAGEDAQLTVYLAAALYEPFASGALLDTAYLLSKLARQRAARIYTFLLLPGIAESTQPEADASRQRMIERATTYAALREINFLYQRPTSYHAHPSLKEEKSRFIINFSPFSSGRCFLIGGKSIGDPTIGFQSLTSENAQNAVARFLYLYATTALNQKLPLHGAMDTAFSSFGILAQDAATGSRNDSKTRLKSDKNRVYQALTHDSKAEAAIMPELRVYVDNAEQSSAKPEELREPLIRFLDTEIHRPGATLASLKSLMLHQIEAVEADVISLKALIESDTAQIQKLEEQFNRSKRALDYISKPGRDWVLPLLLPVWIAGLLLFTTLGSFTMLVLWGAAGLAPRYFVRQFQAQLQSRAKLRYDQDNGTFILRVNEKQKHKDAKAKMETLHRWLKALLEHEKIQSVQNRITAHLAAESSVEGSASLNEHETGGIVMQMLRWILVHPEDAPYDSTLETAIQQVYAERRQGFDMAAFLEKLPDLKKNTLAMVGLHAEVVPKLEEYLIAVVSETDSMRGAAASHRYDHDPVTGTDIIVLERQDNQHYYIRLRSHITPQSLFDIGDCRDAYQSMIVENEMMHRSWLHPTRDGAVTPDIVTNNTQPLLAMLWSALLHLTEGESKPLTERIAQMLRVPQRTRSDLNYDELCGALQDRHKDVQNLIPFENPGGQIIGDSTGVGVTNELRDHLKSLRHKPSERFAAWEVWIYGMIADNFATLHDIDPELQGQLQTLTQDIYTYIYQSTASHAAVSGDLRFEQEK